MSLFTPPSIAFARVAVDRAIDRYPEGLTYAVPADLADLRAGERVTVPLGRGDQGTPGYVVEILATVDLDPARVKPIRARHPDPPLPASLLDLVRWVSSYYGAPIGQAVAGIVPAAVKHGTGRRVRQLVDLPDAPPDVDAADDADAGARAARKLPRGQRAVLEALRALPASARPIEVHELAERAGLRTVGPIRRLLDAGRIVGRAQAEVVAAATAGLPADTRVPQPTPAQARVIDAIGAQLGRGFSTHLVFGVTGSGKTEVYLRLVQRVLDAGRAVVVLVPEIALTPQTIARLVGRFPEARLALLHSGLTAAQRHQQWERVAVGAADLVVGARSAVFAPIPDGRLGLVIVDEEHDASYKQDQAPRYHGRDVAIRRAQMADCPVVLGSATPSLESWWNAVGAGRAALHRLPERAPGLQLPRVEIVDLAEERRARPDGLFHLLGPRLEHALDDCLRRDGQALLLLNRRGYAGYVTCRKPSCGWTLTCAHCDVSIVFHRRHGVPGGGFVRCHHCETEIRAPSSCPACGGGLALLAPGTQRVEEELERKFPALEMGRTMLRLDSDTMRSAHDLQDALLRFGSGEIRVLLGTQMIAKGLDFPGVRLVGVVNADTAIHLPDFRAAERTFQLVAQVAGRCGRGGDAASVARVLVQSMHPSTPAVRLAAAHDYEGFATRELADRRACGLPPFARMARFVVRDADADRADRDARRLAEALRDLAGAEVQVRGPAPCAIPRIADRFRVEVLLVAESASRLQALLARARAEGWVRPGAGLAVDVDPISLA